MNEEYKPKVGEQCEYAPLISGDWSKMVPRFINDFYCVFDDGSGEGDSHVRLAYFKFRAIRSERDIQIFKLVTAMESGKTVDNTYLQLAKDIYDAGGRMP